MSAQQTIPAETLYWAVLNVSALPPASSAKRREQIGFLFERFLPRPIERVHAAYAPLDADRILACGIDIEKLEPIASLTLTPDAIPDHVAESVGTPPPTDSLNLLTGPFEPPRVRALRRRWLIQLTAAAILAIALLLVGVERRAHAARATAADASDAIVQVHAQVLGLADEPQFSRMTSELRRLRQTRRADGDLMPRDPTPDLAAWLATWPADPPVQTQSIVASPSAMTITTSATTNDEAQALIDALRSPPRWTQAQPSLNRTADGVRIVLRLDAEDDP